MASSSIAKSLNFYNFKDFLKIFVSTSPNWCLSIPPLTSGEFLEGLPPISITNGNRLHSRQIFRIVDGQSSDGMFNLCDDNSCKLLCFIIMLSSYERRHAESLHIPLYFSTIGDFKEVINDFSLCTS